MFVVPRRAGGAGAPASRNVGSSTPSARNDAHHSVRVGSDGHPTVNVGFALALPQPVLVNSTSVMTEWRFESDHEPTPDDGG